MNSLENRYDAIEAIIFDKGLLIKGVHFYPEMDIMVIVLNNQKIITSEISNSIRLRKATVEQLNDYKLVGNGAGIHWPAVDEDLSLKGFLQEELIRLPSLV